MAGKSLDLIRFERLAPAALRVNRILHGNALGAVLPRRELLTLTGALGICRLDLDRANPGIAEGIVKDFVRKGLDLIILTRFPQLGL